MTDEEFLEFIKHDLKRIESDLKGFLEVYYPMLRSSWNPQNESDFIIGWLLGSKEQEYSSLYYNKHNQRMGQEFLYRIHQEITSKKQQIQKEVRTYLEEKSALFSAVSRWPSSSSCRCFCGSVLAANSSFSTMSSNIRLLSRNGSSKGLTMAVAASTWTR